MSKKPDFRDALLKLARAEYHIADLRKQMVGLNEPTLWKLRANVDDSKGLYSLHFDSLQNPDRAINAIVGDAIACLRSVLDYSVVAMVTAVDPAKTNVEFPNPKDEASFPKKVVDRQCLGICSQAIQDHFINEVQPYKNGNGHSLWLLNKLRNIDKHRFLISTTQLATVNMGITLPGGNRILNFVSTIGAGESATLVQAESPHITIDRAPQGKYEIMLDEPSLLPKEPMLDVLDRLCRAVKAYLGKLDEAL